MVTKLRWSSNTTMFRVFGAHTLKQSHQVLSYEQNIEGGQQMHDTWHVQPSMQKRSDWSIIKTNPSVVTMFTVLGTAVLMKLRLMW